MPPGVFFTPAAVGHLARTAAEAEALASPKPGLVCPDHQGAHQDMEYAHFVRSAAALEPYFGLCFRAGLEHGSAAPHRVLPLLRALGLTAEAAMFSATGGINTHKGLIFSLGLLCAGLGRVQARQQGASPVSPAASAVPTPPIPPIPPQDREHIPPLAQAVCAEAAALAAGLVQRELAPLKEAEAPAGTAPTAPLTAGQRLYLSHGVTGARGEAEKGFPTALRALGSILREENTLPPECVLPQALLEILTVAEDSNVLARAGRDALLWLRAEAATVLALGGLHRAEGRAALLCLRDACAARGISPGGSADMLAAGFFLRCLLG